MTMHMRDSTASESVLLIDNADIDYLESSRPVGGWCKRYFDVGCSAVALVLFSPLFLMT